MKPIQVESQVGPDGVLHLAVSIGSSEASRPVIVTIEQSPKAEPLPRQKTRSESMYGSCAGLGLEEPPDLSLPPSRVE